MKLQERSYSSKIMRPKPQIHVEEDGSLIVVVTAWGQPEHGERALTEVVKYVSAAKADVEVTSPFEFLTCISDEANYVRTALMIANDALYRGENRKEYASGVEVLALFRRGTQVAWAQVGAPSIFVQRQNQRVQPLSVASDLASELRDGHSLPPLPAQLLGLDPTVNIQTGHTHVNEGDKLILLAGTSVATALWGLQSYETDLNLITQSMVQEEPELPFWLGLIAV
ncbi:protein phosphatase 2C domain-containing protein [Bdellovibrio sp. KM01]|uniref:protein phosphatase 2C domain-containing protein n=1 Tax=Bdellovibrio sp. KM01 TaxID=2748865 RepID=UPI0015EA7212|nr:protein phosphatase 2C domain-containing protein [Bdellovibrio sp. KM01]QLY25881.1 protein phosphatase 2C domain-containing protein [Bdellovibrio sp. KM01]